MNCLRVNSIDEYQSQLMGYNIIGNKIIYLTQSQLCTIRVGSKFKKDSVKIKGANIINFVISKRGYLAFLYKNRTIEIRRMDCLNEVVHRFTNIVIYPEENYPKMRWDYDQLYLIYADNLEILDVKTKSRKGYTDIVVDYENEKMADMVIANIMDSERAVILQLANRLVFTIIPIPITDIYVPFINSMLNLYSPTQANDSRREYIAILSENKYLKIYNLLNLKQISEVDLQPKVNQFLEMESDPHHECILIRYISCQSMQIIKNIIYKINSNSYYCQTQDFYGEAEPFFTYKFQVPINENLTLFPTTIEASNGQIFDYYHLIFFKKGHLYSVFQLIPHSYSQFPTQLKIATKTEWKEVEEWRDIISTYLELSITEIPKAQRHLIYSQQDRQLYEYNIIKNEFDSIIAKFTEKINSESKKNTMNQRNIQDQWDIYMAQIAKERNFMLETMQLFKIQSQIIRKNHNQTQENISKQLETCMKDMEGREQRIDARIKEKKKEIQDQKNQKKEKITTTTTASTTKEEIQKYQEDYENFVAEFMQQTERKQQQQLQKKARQAQENIEIQQRLILTLPSLNEKEKQLIQNFNNENINLPADHQNLLVSHESTEHQDSVAEEKPEWIQMQRIFRNVEEKINSAVLKLEPLVNRLKNIELEDLERIKKNEEAIQSKCNLNLEEMVKNSCKKMLAGLSTKVKKEIESTTRQIYRLQDKNKAYYEQSIQKFKEYIKYQIQNRIQIFYKGRKKLELRVGELAREFSKPQG